jgi:hypothetical protein
MLEIEHAHATDELRDVTLQVVDELAVQSEQQRAVLVARKSPQLHVVL